MENSPRQQAMLHAYKEKEYIENPNKYVSEIVNAEATVIIPCIKYNACLSFNGFRMHLSSKSGGGSTLVYKPAVQLVMGYENVKYIRNIVKYVSQFSFRDINRFDGISTEKNINIFNELVNKMVNTVFAEKFGDLGNKLESKKDLFESLSQERQCYVICELLKILHSNVVSGDLTDLGEAKKSGIATTSSKISEIKSITSVKLVNQSVTGLFEHEIELLK